MPGFEQRHDVGARLMVGQVEVRRHQFGYLRDVQTGAVALPNPTGQRIQHQQLLSALWARPGQNQMIGERRRQPAYRE